MTTEQRDLAAITHDLAQLRELAEQHQLAIAEAVGASRYLTTTLERIAMTAAEFQAKLDELTAKLKDYEAQVASSEAAKDAALASANATVAANQTAIDALNAKVADLTAQVAAGTPPDFTAFAASIQADIDSIPTAPVPAPAS